MYKINLKSLLTSVLSIFLLISPLQGFAKSKKSESKSSLKSSKSKKTKSHNKKSKKGLSKNKAKSKHHKKSKGPDLKALTTGSPSSEFAESPSSTGNPSETKTEL